MRDLLLAAGSLSDWQAFAASWEGLAPDHYLASVGLHRRRRFAVFSATPDGAIAREAHQPHYQSRDYNALQGGIERWFEPVLAEVGESASLGTILRLCVSLFGSLAPQVARWHIEVHQFRIEARPVGRSTAGALAAMTFTLRATVVVLLGNTARVRPRAEAAATPQPERSPSPEAS